MAKKKTDYSEILKQESEKVKGASSTDETVEAKEKQVQLMAWVDESVMVRLKTKCVETGKKQGHIVNELLKEHL
jgi:hypothetical protein